MKHLRKGITNGILYLLAILIITTLISCTPAVETDKPLDRKYLFAGGPTGGKFVIFAKAIPSLAKEVGIKVKTISSSGSSENVRRTNYGKADFSIAYSQHVYLARNGILKYDSNKYENIMVVAWLYGASAKLVVRKGSGIKSVKDLAGKKVSVGNAGSGSFANCELFFTHMEVWNKIIRKPMRINDAATAFAKNKIDAFWLFTEFPSSTLIRTSQIIDIDLLNLDADAKTSGFYKKYPYFTKVGIPEGTYSGVNDYIYTFQDSALWIANLNVPEDIVYSLLSTVYSNEGLGHMHSQRKSFNLMDLKTGATNIVTPFHPGAEKFWKEKGML